VPRGRADNVGIIFGRPAPYIWEEKNNVQKSARFLITSDFDPEYFRNGSICIEDDIQLVKICAVLAKI